MIKIKSPSKIIITGEHFFFYSGKAILLKINNFLLFEGGFLKQNSEENFIDIEIEKFNLKKKISFFYIRKKYKKIVEKYVEYRQNKLEFNKIFTRKEDFLLLILGFFIVNYPELIRKSFKIKIYSFENYLNCKGLGSSASFVVGNIDFLCKLFDLNLSFEEIFEIALLFENFQHGKSSGIDILPIMYNKDGFLIVERKMDIVLKKDYYLEEDFYFNFRNFIKKDFFIFTLTSFVVRFVENSFFKKIYIYRSFKLKNVFKTEEIIKVVSKKKNYLTDKVNEINEIFYNIKNSLLYLEKEKIEDKKRVYLNSFFSSVEKNNLMLYDLDIIPDEDMKFIEEMSKINLIGKLTGSGGKKELSKSAGAFIFFEKLIEK